MKNRGFTLVELSIVLVILGLLVGGVLAGQNLIRAAELRASWQLIQESRVAVATFQEKYFALPGDMPNAYAFWGTDCGTDNTNGSGCNGDNNGQIDGQESRRFWRHLWFAGLINFDFDPTQTSGAPYYPGEQMPAAPAGGGFFVEHHTNNGVAANRYRWTSLRASSTTNAVLSPEEAWKFDTKFDDGMPFTGNIRAQDGTDTGSGSCDQSAEYVLTSTAIACVLNIAPLY